MILSSGIVAVVKNRVISLTFQEIRVKIYSTPGPRIMRFLGLGKIRIK
jgi:hypothetical protein